MRRRKQLTLYCFSPPVMLATFAIEVCFAFYVIWRYKMTAVTRLVVALLACLAVFQGTEFMLCGGLGLNAGMWSKVGYSAITLLPSLGLHLSYAIANKKPAPIVYTAYLTAALFVGYFAFYSGAISGTTCYANYAVFDVNSGMSDLYGLYYYGWLIVGAFTAIKLARTVKPGLQNALYSLTAGYVAFMLPTTVVNLIDPSTISGIPSIMCGFAVILAFVLVGKVAPEAIKQKNNRSLWFKLST